ncbi:MAG: ABC transporter ATP-binding protein [Prolixibacteraceae bacterium]|jgi:iron complex transport system ATP-binding protein|nr:ABC transporter ATP-binding protein [Prolixibacteraceae bacterium]
MKNYLNINNIVAGYHSGFQLKKVNFSIEKGKFAGIIGPNGSGKTTFFKCLTGDLKTLNGSIELNKVDLAKLQIKEKAKKVAVVSQFTEVTDVTVEDYVIMGRMPYRSNFQFFESKEDHEIAEKYMKLTDVFQFKNKAMSELSGGEQQLAAIARALTQEPELLLLDEPTSHLDISHQVQILNLIQLLNDELGLTVLIIIHDLNLASEYCDYLVMMKDGGVHIQGTPSDVLNYQTIEDVYNTVVITRENPVSKKPVVFLVSDRVMKNQ